MRAHRGSVLSATLVFLLLATAGSGTAQSAPAAADWRQPFLGNWELSIDTPDGAQPVSLVIAESGEDVAVRNGFPEPPAEPIADVTRVEESLLARFSVPYEGSDISIALHLTPDGEGLRTVWEVADGEFEFTARATKQ